MPVELRFDPMREVIGCFERLYPDMSAKLGFAAGLHEQEGAWGATTFPDDGSTPEIVLDISLPLEHALEILSHELAHVAAGPEAEHGPAWEAAFDALHAEYCRRYEAVLAERNAD